jgi:uncharacterized protein
MSFRWNTFGWINLAIDLAVVGLTFLAAWWATRRKDLTLSQVATRLAGVLIGGGLIWIFPALLLGGILMISLLARVSWTLATVAVPLLSLFSWRRFRRPALLVGVLLPLGFKIYGEIVEPDRLEVERRQIPIAGLTEPVRIAHLSDLQTDDLRGLHTRVVREVRRYDPHAVVFTGDLMNHRKLTNPIITWMKEARGEAVGYFVGGDVDRGLLVDEICERAGYRFLDKKTDTLFIGLGLLDYGRTGLLKGLVAKTKDADVRLLLSHRPDAMFPALEEPINVLFAGHTHGGQICLPWGPVLTLSAVPKSIAAGGLHRVKHLWISQSRGFGGEGHIAPRIRLFCRPHLLLIDLFPG